MPLDLLGAKGDNPVLEKPIRVVQPLPTEDYLEPGCIASWAFAISDELEGSTVGTGGRPITGWTAETTVNRKEFGLRWNRLTEAGGLVVADEVRILLEIEARGRADS